MIQTPHEFFFDECVKLGIHLPSYGKYGEGMLYFPRDLRLKEECRDILNRSAEKLGLEVLGYRKVPVNPDGIGPTALSVEPDMEQVFLACPDHIKQPEDFEQKIIPAAQLCQPYHQQHGKEGCHWFLCSFAILQDRRL